jgi:hypothetical protein
MMTTTRQLSRVGEETARLNSRKKHVVLGLLDSPTIVEKANQLARPAQYGCIYVEMQKWEIL